MSVQCLIPAKPHAEAKTRLASLLTETQRADLSRWMLRRTVNLAREVVGPVVVVSRDPAVLSEAQVLGARGLLETSPGLNPALTQAARFALGRGASGLLVLPTDLPLLTASDLEEILALAATPPALVIAPCRRGTGTNALLLRPPGIIPFAFGPDSFAAHSAAARASGIEPLVYRAETIALDLDTPEDWEFGLGERGIGDWEPGIGD